MKVNLNWILENNRAALSGEAQFLKEDHIREIIQHMHENEPDAEIIKILRKICITEGKPIKKNQDIIFKQFIK